MAGSDVEVLVGKHKGLDLLPPTPFANKAQRQAPQPLPRESEQIRQSRLDSGLGLSHFYYE
jgi:hypothetical protein